MLAEGAARVAGNLNEDGRAAGAIIAQQPFPNDLHKYAVLSPVGRTGPRLPPRSDERPWLWPRLLPLFGRQMPPDQLPPETYPVLAGAGLASAPEAKRYSAWPARRALESDCWLLRP